MKIFFAVLLSSLCTVPAFAAMTYRCGLFTEANEQVSIQTKNLSVTVYENADERMMLKATDAAGVTSEYEMENNKKSLFFNIYTFKAGPYIAIYYKAQDRFLVLDGNYSANCLAY